MMLRGYVFFVRGQGGKMSGPYVIDYQHSDLTS
jgi:hypothetical protein